MRQTGENNTHATPLELEEFKKTILDFYTLSGRSLPWRYVVNPNPWGVLVSEFMLQQTQVFRVLPYWERWMKLWPAPADLAAAPLETVFREWSGLGYNRRARNLRNCAAIIAARHGGIVPCTPETLITLPGIGAYTAGAIACFAWDYPAVFIETNIRAVLLHFFFFDGCGIKDDELLPILKQTLDHSNPRVWYWALMDYGAELKKLSKNPNRKSAHYTKQSPFIGSFRQIRGALIKVLSVNGPQDAVSLREEVKHILKTVTDKEYSRALETLEKEMMVAEESGVYRIRG
ncbi:MAG: A/G-specific adenine glycosylase [Treponema sp.]|jgi:A/G-specific adenine glycosylase|nr:A/G-specific adenine glycosylase [Treponema sp.]